MKNSGGTARLSSIFDVYGISVQDTIKYLINAEGLILYSSNTLRYFLFCIFPIKTLFFRFFYFCFSLSPSLFSLSCILQQTTVRIILYLVQYFILVAGRPGGLMVQLVTSKPFDVGT